MNFDAKSWFSEVGEALRNAMAWLKLRSPQSGESASTIDSDFEGWVANDPMVTLNPVSRYGDDATGFLAGSEHESSRFSGKDV